MIVDLLANSHLYQGIGARIDRAFKYLRKTDLAVLEIGDHAIDGKNIYARVLTYTTRPIERGVWEAHRHHLDLHIAISYGYSFHA
jgi:YhcH/YjgK/YiaL family protein